MLSFMGDGSTLAYVMACSPAAGATLGSTNASNLSQFSWGTVLLAAGSVNSALTVNVERSSTSNGTFGQIGCSLLTNDSNPGIVVRSFAIDSSAVWHKLSYTAVGSVVFVAALVLGGARKAPVDQFSAGVGGTKVWSTINGA